MTKAIDALPNFMSSPHVAGPSARPTADAVAPKPVTFPIDLEVADCTNTGLTHALERMKPEAKSTEPRAR